MLYKCCEHVCVHLYANVEIQFPCWIMSEFLEECCHNLCSVPGADGTMKNQEETKSFFFSHSKNSITSYNI